MNEMESEPAFLIGVCTYLRPAGLRTLLTALSEQQADIPWRVLVIDNDPAGSARQVFDCHVANFPVPIAYLLENSGGVVAARNAALAATGPHESLLFIDDDSEPTSRWLAAFAASIKKYPDDVLAGHLIAQLEPGASPPDWAQDLWFFATESYDDGQEIPMTGTGNTHLPRKLIHEYQLRFDPKFDAGRGEDTELFLRWKESGGIIRRVNDAVAIEWTPESRTTRKYLRSRSVAAGYGFTRICLHRKQGRLHRVVVVAVDLAVGTARYAAGAVRRDANVRGRAIYDLSIGVGSIRAFAEQGWTAIERMARRD